MKISAMKTCFEWNCRRPAALFRTVSIAGVTLRIWWNFSEQSFSGTYMKCHFRSSECIKRIVKGPLWSTLNKLLIAGCFNVLGNYLPKFNNTDISAKSVKFVLLSLLWTLTRYFPHSEDWARIVLPTLQWISPSKSLLQICVFDLDFFFGVIQIKYINCYVGQRAVYSFHPY